MRDCLIITPTRKRPENAQRLIDTVAATATAQTDLLLAIDDDDDSYAGLKCTSNVTVVRGPRKSCPEWTNEIALERGSGYRALASFGDDHEPVTYGWDTAMLEGIDSMGGIAITYGNDTLQGINLPTAPVMSSVIVAELKWMFLPGLRRLFADNVWKDIGQEAKCLKYMPGVVIRHYHAAFGTAPMDASYAESAASWTHDEAFYWDWHERPDGLPAAVDKVRKLKLGQA